MAMKVIKRSDLLAQMKREEEERDNARRLKAMLANDNLEDVALDLWDTVKFLYEMVIKVNNPDSGTRAELYRQLEEFYLRLAAQGLSTEWESVKESVEASDEEEACCK